MLVLRVDGWEREIYETNRFAGELYVFTVFVTLFLLEYKNSSITLSYTILKFRWSESIIHESNENEVGVLVTAVKIL